MKDILKFPNVKPPEAAKATKKAAAAGHIEVPLPPDWLKPAAREEWLRIAPEMAAYWKPKFADALGIYCQMIAQFKNDPENFGVARMAQLRGLGADLGLTPRAQSLVNR